MRGRHPEARFRLLTNDFAARIGALIPEVEEVYAYRKFGAVGTSEWRQLLRARGWRAERVIGLSLAPDRKLALRMWLMGSGAYADPGEKRVHAVERLAWQFGWRGTEPLPPARLAMPKAQGAVRDVAIWVSARKPSERMTPAQVLGIVRALRSRRHNLKIGVFGVPESPDSGAHLPDQAAQSALASMLRGEGLELATPPTDAFLGELASSGSLIAPDGGMAHIAAAFGKPVIVLMGDIDPAAWRPWSPLAKVLQAPSQQVPDLDHVAIVDAWEAVTAKD
jgi:ADP-heptose:LPS heptosyltransferase